MAILGMFGYLGILATYIYANFGAGAGKRSVQAAGFVMAVVGLCFSPYLTFLEPSVIGATCAWCLLSAICMALVSLLSAGPGWAALKQVGRDLGLAKKPA